MAPPEINLPDYHYQLPEDRIAQHPLSKRDASKLLVYCDKVISHKHFRDIGNYLPQDSTLVFNDTRVIPARLHFFKDTGASIEIFLLHPLLPTWDINIAMLAHGSSTWSCMIGHLKRWKMGQLLQMKVMVAGREAVLTASKIDNNQVKFTWDPPELLFVELVKNAGQVPLPPYMKRKAEPEDRERYQTVYSKAHGAVAAPTAGLHFTDTILNSLESQGVTKEHLTLHVGAGTFQPIKTDSVADHPMHGEQISVTNKNIDHLLDANKLIAVGTTSLRTLESIYWYGVSLINKLGTEFRVKKLAPYQQYDIFPDVSDSLTAVKAHMEANHLELLNGHTEIFIFPPYRIKSCVGLITNFHLPASTLILLVAAFIGKDWHRVYEEALREDYRFLSYGDTSLLIPSIHN